MKSKLVLTMAISISLGFLSCNNQQVKESTDPGSTAGMVDMQKARAFIDSFNAKFLEEFKKGDSVALASHYLPDAELLFPNNEPLKGDGILATWGSMLHMGVTDIKFQTTDLTAGGNLLVETGAFELMGEGGKLIDKGKYVIVWKQTNGEWKIYRDISNTSMPASY